MKDKTMQLELSKPCRLSAAAALCAGLAWPAALPGQTGSTACNAGGPAVPVDEIRTISSQMYEMWPANFQPADPPGVPLPEERDSTGYSGFQRPGRENGLEFFRSLDIVDNAGGTFLFMVYNAGFQIWDIGGASAANPQLLSQRDGWDGDFHEFESPFTEFYFKIWDGAAVDPPGSGDTLLTLAGQPPIGPTIWDASDKTKPFQLYQDTGKVTLQAVAANIGGRSYAFQAATNGVHVYDMTRAREIGPCFENTNTAANLCGGNANPVWRGRLSPWPWGRAQYLDVLEAEIGGQTRHFVAVSDEFFFNSLGAEIREITNVTSLPPASAALVEGLNDVNAGVDLFTIPEEASGLDRHYLGTINNGVLEIYDVTACLAPASVPAETCGLGAGQRVFSRQLGFLPSSAYLQFSESSGRPFLYQGHHSLCSEPSEPGAGDVEHLLDLSGLATGGAIVDIRGEEYLQVNPPQIPPVPAQVRIDYWSSYYDKSNFGFSTFAPTDGKFHGSYFYRAAQTVFDVHQWKGETLRLSGLAEGFRGDAMEFSATASGCTPSATYSWSATGGGQISGSGQTVQITWSTTGTKTVTVSNSGCPEAEDGSATIEILEPAAAAGSVVVSPPSPVQCEQVAFTATGVSGKPPITYAWEITRNSDLAVVASDSGTALETFAWQTDAGTAAAGYTAELTVSNAANPAGDVVTAPFTVGAPPPLTTPDPTYDGFPDDPASTTVQFRLQSPGATQWTWDFGDGTVETFTSRAAGENPTHTFAVREAPYEVTVTVSNCLVPGGLGSSPLSVKVDQVLEVVTFQAQGCRFGCNFTVGDTVTFVQEFTGGPTSFEYDWDGNGTFEQTSATPITTHTYTSAVSGFFPEILIRRGPDQASKTHAAALTVNPQVTPSHSLSGPTTREVNQSGTYQATASNCSPTPSGWTWTASGGGQISGNTSSSQVSITWSTPGTKTVTARNAACSAPPASRIVTVSGAQDDLSADFSFTPSNPIAGQPVSFDGSASTGSIVEYDWRFGDGSSREKGMTAEHVFANGGSYQVTLTVVSIPGCVTSVCFDSVTKTVEVFEGAWRLVLPFFEVGTGASAGITTVFAVRNASETEVSVKYEYFSSKGASLFTETLPLGPRATRTVTLSGIPELFDPDSDLATGYLHVSPEGSIPPASVLSGDFFRIDEDNNFASGDLLARVPDLARGEMCQFWDIRYLSGGDFDGGTEFTFYVPENEESVDPVVFGDVYDLGGNFLQTLSITESDRAFEINSEDLELLQPFGVIEWSFREGLVGNVSGLFKASGRFEAGLRGICQDGP